MMPIGMEEDIYHLEEIYSAFRSCPFVPSDSTTPFLHEKYEESLKDLQAIYHRLERLHFSYISDEKKEEFWKKNMPENFSEHTTVMLHDFCSKFIMEAYVSLKRNR